jgi:Glycosyl transferases group 1
MPTVATRRGGIPEVIVDGKTGRLVEAADVAGLRAAIADLLKNDVQRHKMGQAARERVKLFTEAFYVSAGTRAPASPVRRNIDASVMLSLTQYLGQLTCLALVQTGRWFERRWF